MIRRSSRHRCRAFTITELLIAIGILGIFAAVATQVFYATFRVGAASAKNQDAAGTFDSALSALRADAWVASEIAAPDPATAKLAKITWTIKDSVLTRDAGGNPDAAGARPRTWPVPAGTTFVADGASLILRVPTTSGERGGDVRMASQSLVLSRLAPS
jgi:prepilin-type N-terminal cleavage/methylation domain-containing protein